MSGVQLKLNSKLSKKKKSLDSSAFSSGHGAGLSMDTEEGTEAADFVIPVRHSSREQFISSSRQECARDDTSLGTDNAMEEIVDADQYGLIPMGAKPVQEESGDKDEDKDKSTENNVKPSSTGLFGNVTKPKSGGAVATSMMSITNSGESNLSRQLAFDTTVAVEDINPTSEAYKKIPVSEFGKAMLRGMGWKGPDDNENDWMQKEQEKLRKPRENLLGLGAKSTVQKKKEDEAKRKAHEVSGNDKTLTSGKSKGDSKGDEGDASGIPVSSFDMSDQQNVKRRKTDNGDSISSHKSKRSDKDKSKQSDKSDKKTAFWLRAGIQVRIVSKKVAGSSNDGKKANILDVQANGICTLSLHSDGKVVDGVKQKYLETVIPSIEKQCMVLKGDYSGQSGRLHEKDKEKETVVIELNEEMEYVVLKMDDVSAAV